MVISHEITGLIYMAVNKKNGKVYVGQTVRSLTDRKKQYKYDVKRKSTKFYSAIKEYGWEAFKWEVVESGITDLAELNRLETYYIQELNSMEQ